MLLIIASDGQAGCNQPLRMFPTVCSLCLQQQRAQHKMLDMQAVLSLLGQQPDRGKRPATQHRAALHGHQAGATPLQFALPSGGGTSAGLGLTGRGMQARRLNVHSRPHSSGLCPQGRRSSCGSRHW